jgi:hypothetical protein
MKHNVDAVLANVLGLNDEPVGNLNGERTDVEPHPVTRLFHEAEFHIPPPGTAAPVKKSPSIDEIEKQLAERRKARRMSFAEQNSEFLKSARETIQTFCKENRADIVAAGSFEKLFG